MHNKLHGPSPPGVMMASSASLAEVEVLLFDLDATIIDWHASIVAHLQTFGDKRSLDRDWVEFAAEWQAHETQLVDLVRQGFRAWEPLHDLQRESLLAVLVHFELDRLDWAEVVELTTALYRLQPWPDVSGAFPRLTSMARLVCLSSAAGAMSAAISRPLGLQWDQIIGSDLTHTYAPCPHLYLDAARHLGLQPAQIMIATAHDRTLEIAAPLGFRTALVVRPNKLDSTKATDVEPSGDWDIVSSDLHDLATRFERRRAQLSLDTSADPDPAPLHTDPEDRKTGGFDAIDLSRTRKVTLAIVVGAIAALSFNAGYTFRGGPSDDQSPSTSLAQESTP